LTPFVHCKRPASFIVGQSKHIVMSKGVRIITIPRHNPINAFTMTA
jgi:hypothetical protein